MSGLTAVSLFAGIGGFDLAMKRAGVKVAASVEIDPACRGVLRRHFPDTKIFNDVTEVTGDQLRAAGFVPERGILTGGFPCQDLSVAGRRAGLGGTRSGLFWHIMRLADELRPRWLILENVPGLLSAVCTCDGDGACVANGHADRCGEWRSERLPRSADELTGDTCPACSHGWDVHDAGNFCAFCNDTCSGLSAVCGRKVFVPGVPHQVRSGACPGGCMAAHGGAMGTVLGAVGERGYGFAYRVLDAQFFGVPQRRRRVFIAGCLGDPARPVEVLLEPEGGDGDYPQGGEARPGTARGAGVGTGRTGVVGALTRGSLSEYDDNTAQAGHLLAHAITAREAKGPDSDATSGFVVASTLQGGGRRGHRVDAEGAAGGHLVPVITGTPRSHPGPASNGAGMAIPVALRGRDGGSAVECGDPGDPAFTVRTPGGGSSYPMVAHALTAEGADASEDGTGRGTPLVTVNIAASLTAGNAAGGGIRPPGRRQEDDVNLVASPSAFGVSENQRGEVLETPYSHQLTTGGGKPGQGYGAVRRLTPRECERLQGFPDDWTRRLDDGTEQSDSARYRECGNAVAVPVVEWISRRVVAVDQVAEAEGAA